MKKPLFILALVFLAIGIVVPTAIFIYNANLNQSIVIVNNPSGQVTGGNTTAAQGFNPIEGISNIIPITVLIVFLCLFALTFYLSIRSSRES